MLSVLNIREVRRLRQQKRQERRHERLTRKYQGILQRQKYHHRHRIPPRQQYHHRHHIPQRQQDHHRHLKLNDYSEQKGFSNYEVQNNNAFRQQSAGRKQSLRNPIMFPSTRQPPIERQATLFAATPLLSSAGLAWLTGMFTLAAMVREPLSTVLGGSDIGSVLIGSLLNGKYVMEI